MEEDTGQFFFKANIAANKETKTIMKTADFLIGHGRMGGKGRTAKLASIFFKHCAFKKEE